MPIAEKYKNIIILNERYAVVRNFKFGIYDTIDKREIISLVYDEIKIQKEDGIVILIRYMEGNSLVFNTRNGACLGLDDIYNHRQSLNGVIVLDKVLTSSSIKKSIILRSDTMRIIIGPCIINNIVSDMSIRNRAIVEYEFLEDNIGTQRWVINDNYSIYQYHEPK